MDVSGYGRWTVTGHGRQVLRGASKVELRKESMQPPLAKASGKRSASAAPASNFSGADRALFDALKAARQEIAKTGRVPAYVVFADRSLIEMVHLKPDTPDRMEMVHGVGKGKLEKYGESFIAIIRRHLAAAAEPEAKRAVG
jgi:ATP-dependent DNA helicase RecQ